MGWLNVQSWYLELIIMKKVPKTQFPDGTIVCSRLRFLLWLIVSCFVCCNQADWWKAHQKTPTTVPGHCLTGLLELLGLPMFTNLKLSLTSWWTALLRDRHQENSKTKRPLVGGGGGGGEDASCSLGSLCVTDVAGSSSNNHTSRVDI